MKSTVLMNPLLIQYKIGYLKRCNLILVQATLQVPVAERIPAFMNTLKLTIISSVMVMITSII